MPRKAKLKTVRKTTAPTKAELVKTLKEQQEMLEQGRKLMDAMQSEIKQLTTMHRTQLQIIDNLSQKIRDI